MSWLIVLVVVIVLMFGFVLLFGAPYLPTLKAQQLEALKLLNLKPGQTLVELGSGDGRMLLTAASQGIKGIGIELNPLLFIVSWILTYKHRHLIKVQWGNFWSRKLPSGEGIYVFLLERYMSKLDKKITQERQGSVKLVSYAFKVPNKPAVTGANGLFLYEYPAIK